MITDPQKIRRGDPGRPEICNVFSYEKLFGTPADRVAEIDRTCRTGRARLPRPQGRDLRADRGVPAPVPRAPRAGARGPRRARADPRPRAPSAPARSRCRTWSARRRRWGCERRRRQARRPGTEDRSSDLDVFEGPFDLLVTLILNEDVDLLEVHLAEIVLAYVERLEARGELDLEAATEFLILIAALLELKSRLMLPVRGRARASTSTRGRRPRSCSRGCSSTSRFRAASEWMHERLAAEQGYRYRAAPLPPELRRVTIEAAGKVYEPQRLADSIAALLRVPPPVDTSHMTRVTVSLERRLAHLRDLLRSRTSFSFDDAVGRVGPHDPGRDAVRAARAVQVGRARLAPAREFRPDRDHGQGRVDEPHRPTADRAAVLLARAGEPRRPVRGDRLRRAAPRRCGRAAARALRARGGGHRAARGRRRAHARVRPRGRRRRAQPAVEAAHPAALAGAGGVPGDRRLPAAGGAPGDRAHPRRELRLARLDARGPRPDRGAGPHPVRRDPVPHERPVREAVRARVAEGAAGHPDASPRAPRTSRSCARSC